MELLIPLLRRGLGASVRPAASPVVLPVRLLRSRARAPPPIMAASRTPRAQDEEEEDKESVEEANLGAARQRMGGAAFPSQVSGKRGCR